MGVMEAQSVRVVLVTMFEPGEALPGELTLLRERLNLHRRELPCSGMAEAWANDDGVLAVVAGVGTANTAVSLTALGFDAQLDLSRAYWVITGIAGVNPRRASLASPVWADWVVDGDLAHEIDAREIPPGWDTGILPLGAREPYGYSVLPRSVFGTPYQVFRLNPDLLQWAYGLTRDLPLLDETILEPLRKAYADFPAAASPPKVQVGAQLAAARYWHGQHLNDWADQWVQHWTGGAASFTTSGMEDSGSLQALRYLHQLGRVDFDRVLLLRTASNFTMPPVGGDPAASLHGDPDAGDNPYPAYLPALDNGARCVMRVTEELLAGDPVL